MPASFDASARELTREAALAAGLPQDLVLLEEPQAAVYAWLADRGEGWRRALAVGDTLLVCDVGGGTTDLTLVGVAEEHGELVLQRMAVGNHLLVGGDNMDLALAHFAAGALRRKGREARPLAVGGAVAFLPRGQGSPAGRAPAARRKHPVAVLGRGSRLIGGTVSIEVDRDGVSKLLIEGFFPRCELSDRPARRAASGFREIGLPYEADTAVTRHLAAFLQAHGRRAGGRVRPRTCSSMAACSRPTSLRERLMEVLGQWFGRDQSPRAARRAARPRPRRRPRGGLLRLGQARRRRAHSRRRGPVLLRRHRNGRSGRARRPAAIAGVMRRPDGHGRGRRDRRAFRRDRPGRGRAGAVPLLQLLGPQGGSARRSVRRLEPGRNGRDRLVGNHVARRSKVCEEDYVPVRFHSRITELGVLELWCVGTKTAGRWKLEFSVRGEGAGVVLPIVRTFSPSNSRDAQIFFRPMAAVVRVSIVAWRLTCRTSMATLRDNESQLARAAES